MIGDRGQLVQRAATRAGPCHDASVERDGDWYRLSTRRSGGWLCAYRGMGSAHLLHAPGRYLEMRFRLSLPGAPRRETAVERNGSGEER